MIHEETVYERLVRWWRGMLSAARDAVLPFDAVREYEREHRASAEVRWGYERFVDKRGRVLYRDERTGRIVSRATATR